MSLFKSIAAPWTVSEKEHSKERDEDWIIVQKVQAGDVAAFDKLITKYRERLYSVIYNLTSNREDASDLTQEAFIKAFRSIQRFKGKSSFFTWIYRIAVNGTYTHLRKFKNKRYFSLEETSEELPSEDIVSYLSAKNGSDRSALIGELQERLNEALQTLSIKHRTVVVLYEVEGLSHQEVADVTKTSVGTVRSRLHYAKKQLQNYLKDYIDN